MKKFRLSILSVIILVAAVTLVVFAVRRINQTVPVDVANNATIPPAAPTNIQTPPPTPSASGTQPSVLNLPIPFTSQAPTANWDLVHNEDCEEAVSVMANAYLTGNQDVVLPAPQVETEMNNLNSWEDAHFGYHLDTTAEETAQMIEAVYGLKATVQNGYTFQDIKDQLNLHHVVILPEDGRLLGNPNYTQPGPIYHMLVVRGYTATGLITNDSGTRRGQNYPYTFSTLYNAGADWDHSTNTVDQSKKVMIIVSK